MPLALILALAGSLAIHAVLLFDFDIQLSGDKKDRSPLLAELRMPPPPSPKPPPVKAKPKEKKAPLLTQAPTTQSQVPAESNPVSAEPAQAAQPVVDTPQSAVVSPPVEKPILPSSGGLRYVIYKGTQGFEIGRAEQHWEFTDDGRYKLVGITETSGLVSLFKRLRVEVESQGRLVASGLQPESFRTRKGGADSNENADFDWAAAQVTMARDGKVYSILPGTQDILSLAYQLAYLPNVESGSSIGVVTGKKYNRFDLDSLGEEEIDTPAGHFRTLHVRAIADGMTEIWIALDLYRLPVKIRVTEKGGDVYEQMVSEIPQKREVMPPSTRRR